jgi:predicted RNA-binding protein YlqC (UPF0109 family)
MIKFFKKIYSNLPWIKERALALRNVKLAIRHFYEGDYDSLGIAPDRMPIKDLGIFDIKIRRLKPILEIEIYLDRPGLLIGKAGRNYDALKAFLEAVFNQPVKINIIEVKFW